jgi:hypothetical protein
VHDAEMRHGRKSARKRFNGHKAALAVDLESQLIAGVEVLAGNAGDQEKALDLAELSQLRGLESGKWFVFNEGFSKVGTTFSVSVARFAPTRLGP